MMLWMRQARLVEGQKEERTSNRGEFDAKAGVFFFFFCMSEFSMADVEQKARVCGRQAWNGRQTEIELDGEGVIECEKYGKWR